MIILWCLGFGSSLFMTFFTSPALVILINMHLRDPTSWTSYNVICLLLVREYCRLISNTGHSFLCIFVLINHQSYSGTDYCCGNIVILSELVFNRLGPLWRFTHSTWEFLRAGLTVDEESMDLRVWHWCISSMHVVE